MRIALCISGQPRGLPICLEQIKKNVIHPNNITDIFVHAWYDKSFDGKPFDSAQPAQEDGRLGCWKPNTDVIINDTLKPKKILIEKPKDFSEFSDLPGQPSAIQTKIASIFYGIWKANGLKKEYEKENNIEYDVVIRTRFDLHYYDELHISNYIQEIKEGDICVAHKFQAVRQGVFYNTRTGEKYESMNDTFLFGNSINMDKLCDTYPHFREIHQEIYPTVYGESFLGYNTLFKHKLRLKLIPFDYDILHRIINLRDM